MLKYRPTKVVERENEEVVLELRLLQDTTVDIVGAGYKHSLDYNIVEMAKQSNANTKAKKNIYQPPHHRESCIFL